MRVSDGVRRFERRLETTIRAVTVTFLAVLCVNVFLQVVLRYGFGYSTRWTLEISRYLMIWVVLLASGPALKHGALVGVDTAVRLLPPRLRFGITATVRGLMGVFSVLMIVQSFKLMRSQWEMEQASPALEVPMALVSLGIPLGFLLFGIYLAILTYTDFHGGRD
jgi:TRAP-type transport system small permease protein